MRAAAPTLGAPSSPRALAYLVLLGLGALDSAGYGIIVPVVPEIARHEDVGGAVTGALVASFGLGQLAGYAVAAVLLARRGAVSALAGGLGLMVLGDLGFLTGGGLLADFAARILQGVGAGGVWMGLTFAVMERWPGRDFERLVGLLSSYSVGAVAGPLLGSIGGVRGPFAAHLLLVLAGLLAVPLLGKPVRPLADATRSSASGTWSPMLVVAAVSIFGVAADFATMESALPIHLASLLSQGGIGALYAGGALLVTVGATASPRLPHRISLALGLGLALVGIATVGLTSDVASWVAGFAVAGLGFGFAQAGSLGDLLRSVGAAKPTVAMMIWSQFFALGYLLGPVVSGAVVSAGGFGAVGLVPLVVLIVVAGSVAAFPAGGDPASGGAATP